MRHCIGWIVHGAWWTVNIETTRVARDDIHKTAQETAALITPVGCMYRVSLGKHSILKSARTSPLYYDVASIEQVWCRPPSWYKKGFKNQSSYSCSRQEMPHRGEWKSNGPKLCVLCSQQRLKTRWSIFARHCVGWVGNDARCTVNIGEVNGEHRRGERWTSKRRAWPKTTSRKVQEKMLCQDMQLC